MAEVYTGGDRSLQALLKSYDDRLRELEKPGATEVQRVVTRVVEAKNEAVAAAEQAQQVQQEVVLDQMVDPGNLFDYAPIIAKDASLFWTARQPTAGVAYYEPAGVPNIVEWFPDGFTVESTEPGLLAIGNRRTFNMGPEVRYNTRFSAAFSPSSNPWPNYVYARLGLWVGPYSWPAVDGPIGLDQPVIGSPTLTPNPGYDREFYYPDSTWAISTFPGDPDRTTWRPAITLNFTAAGQRFTIRKIRMQVIAGTLDFTGGSTIPGGSLVDGSVTAAKLDPSISFGVADGAVTTPKLADAAVTTVKIADTAVTDVKIAGMAATKLTGTIDQARIPAVVSGKTSYSAQTVEATTQFTGSKLVSSRGDEIVPGYFQVDNLRSNNATTYTQTIANATWTAMNVPTAALASHVTTYNTMGIGVSGSAVYVPKSGLYEFDVNAVFGNATGGTARSIAFSVNGSASYVWESANRQPSYVNAVLLQRAFAKLALNANDYVQVMFRQDSGAALGLCRIENYGVKFIGSS